MGQTRKPEGSDKPRGSDAESRLLEAAVDVFGELGFSAATTRLIAEKATVNIAAIPYYFGGKEGLYQAVVGHIAEKVHQQVAATLRDLSDRQRADCLNCAEALDLLETLMGELIDLLIGSPDAPRFVRIILREQLYPSSAYDIIFNRIMDPVLGALADLITVAAGGLPPRTAKLRALAVMGQIMAFRVARETLVRSLGLTGYSQPETAEVCKVILDQTRAALEGLAGGSQNPRPGPAKDDNGGCRR